MKQLLLAAGLAAVPMFSSAELSEEFYDFVDVEYWGRLENCSYGDCSDFPSVLHGRLEIDLSLAPRDQRPDDPLFGDYSRGRGFVAPGFVIASGQSLLARSADQVIVADLNPLAAEAFRVQNHASITVDGEVVAEQSLEVGLVSLRNWGIEGDSIVQQFDVRTTDIDGDGRGTVQQFLDGIRKGYSFFVDRLRVTPRVCRP